jgi:hypothetical protein
MQKLRETSHQPKINCMKRGKPPLKSVLRLLFSKERLVTSTGTLQCQLCGARTVEKRVVFHHWWGCSPRMRARVQEGCRTFSIIKRVGLIALGMGHLPGGARMATKRILVPLLLVIFNGLEKTSKTDQLRLSHTMVQVSHQMKTVEVRHDRTRWHDC